MIDWFRSCRGMRNLEATFFGVSALFAGAIMWLGGAGAGDLLVRLFFPLLAVTVSVRGARIFERRTGCTYAPMAYLFFFSVSATSYIGATQTLTGSHAESTNAFLWGLSFYTASIAFALYNGLPGNALRTANPLLLFTGPILTRSGWNWKSSVRRRVYCYVPYLVVGVFFFGMLGFQLGRFLWMIDLVEIWEVLFFAAVFELFVYFNFAGLSLIVFAGLGLMGMSVPLNFRQPFSSRNLVEFWRGWHVSLSQVLRTLFYEPARMRFGSSFAILVVFLASALWHGVTVNFLLWGTFHAFAFWVTVKLLRNKKQMAASLVMLPAIVFGRLLFSDSNTERLLSKLQMSSTFESVRYETIHPEGWYGLVIALGIVAAEFFGIRHRLVRTRNYKFLRTPLAQSLIVLLLVLGLHSGGGAAYAVYGQM